MVSIDTYNEIVGELYKTNPELFMYSPAFCRCEGQTRLYEAWKTGETGTPLRFGYSVVKFFAKAARDVFYSLLSGRADLKEFPKDGVLLCSYFDRRINASGVLREEYLRNIPENEPDVVCVYKLVNPGFMSTGPAYIRLLRRLRKPFKAITEHDLVTIPKVVRATLKTIRHAAKLRSIRLPEHLNKTIVSLVLWMHYRECIDGTVYANYLLESVYEKMLSLQPRVLLSVWENQPWERILETCKKRISPQAVSVGFQHTGFSKKLLQHFPSSHEVNLPSYPDIIFCNGTVNRDELAKNPAFTSRVRVGGALRQDSILSKGVPEIRPLRANELKHIAFAFPWDQSVYQRILDDLTQVPNYINVHLKFHPDYPSWCDYKPSAKHLHVSRKSWAELSKECSLVLANDNSLMFEGFYYGMHTAVYDVGAEGEKRDFSSPLAHLTRDHLKNLSSEASLSVINASTKAVIEGGYLSDYFSEVDISSAKARFLRP